MKDAENNSNGETEKNLEQNNSANNKTREKWSMKRKYTEKNRSNPFLLLLVWAESRKKKIKLGNGLLAPWVDIFWYPVEMEENNHRRMKWERNTFLHYHEFFFVRSLRALIFSLRLRFTEWKMKKKANDVCIHQVFALNIWFFSRSPLFCYLLQTEMVCERALF